MIAQKIKVRALVARMFYIKERLVSCDLALNVTPINYVA